VKTYHQPGASQARPEPVPKPGVIVGDEVYCHHPAGPHAGRVASHGKHGVTLEGGIKGRWEHVLGHKRRAGQEYTVVDEGEDGCIVQDKNGLKQFIAVPPEARQEQMIVKSQAGERLALFIKADGSPYMGRAGLTKKQIVDKRGVTTTKWVRAGQDMPAPKVGHHVGWVNGMHKGHGQVMTSGADGVTAKDPAGGVHRVPHGSVTHHWASTQPPDRPPHDTPTIEPPKPGELFGAGEHDHLPAKVNQPHNNWDDLVKHGTEGLEQFKGLLGKVGQAMGLKSGVKPDALTPEDWGSGDGYLFVAPLKGEKRAREKVEADYGGDFSQLRDVVRATISVPSMDHVKEALQHLKANGLEFAQKPKDRFAKPTPEGYRDLMTFVKLPNGMLAELQIHTKAMTLAKEEGHGHYEQSRGLQAKYGEDEPSDKWSSEDHTAFYESRKAQQAIYNKAWEKAGGGQAAPAPGKDAGPAGGPAGGGALTKSEQPGKLLLLVRN
jgi:hypothetical protein